MDRLATLTFGGSPPSRRLLTATARRFFERFRARYGKRPIVAVFERGGQLGRWHIHLALNFYVPKPVLQKLWGHGFVDIRKSGRSQERWRQRDLASYLAKYVAKSLEEVPEEGAEERAKGEHRYLVTQGFTPGAWSLRCYRVGQAYERMLSLYGKPDLECPFGDWEEGLIFGIWYAFPDHCLHPPPQPTPKGKQDG
jgi:hypothetical protein